MGEPTDRERDIASRAAVQHAHTRFCSPSAQALSLPSSTSAGGRPGRDGDPLPPAVEADPRPCQASHPRAASGKRARKSGGQAAGAAPERPAAPQCPGPLAAARPGLAAQRRLNVHAPRSAFTGRSHGRSPQAGCRLPALPTASDHRSVRRPSARPITAEMVPITGPDLSGPRPLRLLRFAIAIIIAPLRLESRPQLRFDHFGFDQNTGSDRLTWTDGQTETQTDRDRQTDRQTTHADTRTHTTQNACVRTHPIAKTIPDAAAIANGRSIARRSPAPTTAADHRNGLSPHGTR